MSAILQDQKFWELVSKFGVPIVLCVVFSFVILWFSIWLVRSLLRSYENERKEHQEFLSGAIKANTEQLKLVSDRFNDTTTGMYRMIDSFIAYTKNVEESVKRIENADRYQREEHVKMIEELIKIREKI